MNTYFSAPLSKSFQVMLDPSRESVQLAIGAPFQYVDLGDPLSKFEEIYPSGTNAESVSIEKMLNHFRSLGGKIENPSRVRDYLYRYPDMVELPPYVTDLAIWCFSPDLELSLEVYQDQETQYERLTLYIRQYNYDENIMKIINKIRRDYHQLFPNMRGRFLLTTDFRALR